MSNPFEIIDARLSNIESLLLDLKHNPGERSIPTESEEFLTVQETAKFLKLSVPTVYTIIHEKRIPFMKRSKRCYFLKKDLSDYLKNGREKSTSELSGEADKYINKK